jgi:pimeloyl-ACP methyl ester carboxylesterase
MFRRGELAEGSKSSREPRGELVRRPLAWQRLRMSRFFLPLMFVALMGCSTASLPQLPPAKADRATILVPGYKGSFLADEHGERVWITPGAVLTSGDISLALPFPGEREDVHAAGPLHPDGPITRLSIAGIGESAYLPFLQYASRELQGVTPFSYDWRKDVRESAKELCAAIEALPVKHVDIVAHSMGGLVTLHCLAMGAPKVRRVVFAGTPFAGSPLVFKNLARGDPVGRNDTLISAQAMFTFTAAWQLAPADAEMTKPETWLAGLGPFVDPQLRTDPSYQAELRHQLEQQKDHWRALEHVSPGVRSLVILGTGRKTVSGVSWQGGAPDFDHPQSSDGDGTVPAESAVPKFPHEEVTVHAEHLRLLDDEAAEASMTRFFSE